MITFSQLAVKCSRVRRQYKTKTPLLFSCPQRKGYCKHLLTKSPKKPHSARRRCAHLVLMHTKRLTYAYIPGCGHSLQKHSSVLMRGGRRRDIPGMKYTLIRGVYDFGPLYSMRRSRSKYGVKNVVKY